MPDGQRTIPCIGEITVADFLRRLGQRGGHMALGTVRIQDKRVYLVAPSGRSARRMVGRIDL